jgi:hypothetical protein
MGKFSEAVARFSVDSMAAADDVMAAAIREVGERVISHSPVDTGRFRSNHNYAAGAPDINETEATNIRQVNHIQSIPKVATAFTHFISNSLPYATALERGHSKQAPEGVYGLRALEWEDIVEAAALKVKR